MSMCVRVCMYVFFLMLPIRIDKMIETWLYICNYCMYRNFREIHCEQDKYVSYKYLYSIKDLLPSLDKKKKEIDQGKKCKC